MKRTGIIVLLVLLTLVGVTVVLLNTSYFQQRLVDIVTKELSERTGAKISIEDSDFSLFRGLVFHEIQINDSLNRPVLKAARLDVGIRILPLFRKKLEMNELRFIKADIHLSRATPTSELNIQPFINAFKKPKKSTIVPWHIDLTSIVFRFCRVRYSVLSKRAIKKGFDPNHLDLHDMSAKVGIIISPNNHYQFWIYKFNAVEKCGLIIDQLKLQAKLSEKGFNLKDFQLKTAGSTVDIGALDAKYSGFSTFKHFADSVKFEPSNIRLSVTPSDFACFDTTLSNLSKPIDLSIAAEGSLSDLNCKKLRMNMQNLVLLDARIQIKGLPDFHNLIMNGQIDMLKIHPEGLEYVSGILTHRFVENKALHNLGTINYMGYINTINHNWVLKGDFATAAGNFGTNIQLSKNKEKELFYEGKIVTKSFNLNILFPEKRKFGEVAFDVSMKGMQDSTNGFSGTVDGLVSNIFYNGYNYQNFALNGKFNRKIFEGNATLDDVNAKLNFSGLINFSTKDPEFRFDLMAKNVNLNALKLSTKNGESSLSFNMHSNFVGKSIDQVKGQLSLDSVAIYNNQEWFRLKHLQIDAGNDSNNQHITLTSELINGDIWGRYDFSSLTNSFNNLVGAYCPSLLKPGKNLNKGGKNNFSFHYTIAPLPDLTKVLNLPFNIIKPLEIQGFYNEITGKFRFKTDVPQMSYGKLAVESAGILFENPQKEAKLIVFAQIGSGSKEMILNLDARAINDITNVRFTISNSAVSTYSGNLQSDLKFSRLNDGLLKIDAVLKESKIIVNDSIWKIHPTIFRWENKRLFVEDFQLTHAGQYIKMQGFASENKNDTLSVLLNSFSLDDLFRIIPTTSIHFGGLVSGNAECMHIFKDPTMDADLSVENFSFNHALLGSLKAKSKWNNSIKALALDGVVLSNTRPDVPSRKIATATGVYFPTADSMYLSIDADRAPLGFLEPYLGRILYKLEGAASGNVRLVGPMKKLGVYARTYVENASFGVQMLNTRYYFSDSVILTPRVVVFRNVKVRDKDGNTGTATGLIRHNRFKNSQISIEVQAKNMLAMDIPASPNAYFYGTAYGTGTVSINGPQGNIVIDVNVRTEDRTKATISFLDDSEVADYGFINFIQKKKVVDDVFDLDFGKKRLFQPVVSTPTNLTVNLQIDATPNAELTLITDPSTGDEIKARGTGALRAVISQAEDIKLFGRYTIETGSYKFVYENLLRRDFNIEKGSSINFSGDPFAAELNIKANYTVNAKLSDLLSTSDLNALQLNRSSIPVNCVLKLDGELRKPGIQLGLAYPSADDELRRRLANAINTDEMLNQQIVFLLLFGRFNTPTYSTSQGTSNMTTVFNAGISTLAAQFNNMLGDVFGKSNMSFDFDYRNAAYELGAPGEWKVGMSGQWLNNRLTFNGNLGSRENLAQTGGSQFIGEFDINLKMKNSEKWSWKVFNRANDNRYFKSALNTQGAGIVYKEDYDKLSDLFKKMVESLQKPFRKVEKKE